MGIPDRKTVNVKYMDMWRIVDGTAVDDWARFDMLRAAGRTSIEAQVATGGHLDTGRPTVPGPAITVPPQDRDRQWFIGRQISSMEALENPLGGMSDEPPVHRPVRRTAS